MDKVLHILPMDKMSGAEKMVLILCKNMNQYEPIVVCGGKKLSSVFKKNGIESYDINFSNKRIFNSLIQIKKIIKNNDIKIIHAHDNNASFKSYLVKKLYGLDIKIISHIHSCYPFLKVDGINRKVDSIFRPKYDYNITCGKLVYDYYYNNAEYFHKCKANVLSNAIDIDEVLNIKNYKSVRNEFNIPTDKKILGFVGRICDIKGILPFVKEIAKYKEDFKDCKVLLIGSGDQENEVKNLIKKLDLEELFILTGFQENTYKFYTLIDIFFLPSRYEGLPMVILEAMIFNKTVISMDVGSINEVIKDGETGYLIKSGNYHDFVTKLKEIKSKDELIKNIGENAFKYVSRNYNIKVYVENIETLYTNQIKGDLKWTN